MAKTFILSGNAAYENKGCEAITRGTVKILNHHFGNDTKYISESHIDFIETLKNQQQNEFDSSITHIRFTNTNRSLLKKLTPQNTLEKTLTKYSIYGIPKNIHKKKLNHQELLPYLDNCHGCLSVGGDNYSLDYGLPKAFIELDDLVLHYKKPIIIWGASVGPFSKNPSFEKYMAKHLRKITAIFAREDKTVEYLHQLGVIDNVYRISDPAFAMEPVKPDNVNTLYPDLKNSIGINFSPMLARFWADGSSESWIDFCVTLTKAIIKKTNKKIVFVPHVTDSDSSNPNNDYLLLQTIFEKMPDYSDMITVLPPNYTAEETKYLIGQLAAFIGSRTHSTIAAFSTLVPTISLAYSIKALGINKEVYGDLSYCLDQNSMENPEIICDLLQDILDNREAVVDKLSKNIPIVKQNAYKAGEILKNIL